MIQQLYSSGFPITIWLVGGHFGQNWQKLNENYKINIFMAKQWGDMGGQVNFSGSGGIPSQSHPLGETLLILMGDIKIQRDLDYLTLFL